MTSREAIDAAYRVNDHLTALAADLGVRWPDDEAEDRALNEATYAVLEAFGLLGEALS